jgi:hypothetical protein
MMRTKTYLTKKEEIDIMSKRTNAYDPNLDSRSQNGGAIDELQQLVFDLHANGECGRAAAEYNLVKGGVIEVASEHVPGHLRDNDVFFEHSEWKLTELGRTANTEALTSIILQNPPLEIALWDAMNEARDVGDNCGGCESDDPVLLDHRRLLANLLDRVERVRAAGHI